MKPCLLLARLCDLCHSWKAARANRFLKILFIKNKLSDRMIKQLLNSVIAKYRDSSVSRRSVIDLASVVQTLDSAIQRFNNQGLLNNKQALKVLGTNLFRDF